MQNQQYGMNIGTHQMNIAEIRRLAVSALSGFETLDRDDAVEGAIYDLSAMLKHVADDPGAIALVERIEARIRTESVVCDGKRSDLIDV